MAANLPVPSSISGERSIGTPYADLQVKARPTNDYIAPTVQHIPDAPKENAFTQLADAMGVLNPALTKFAAVKAEEARAEDIAAAQKKFHDLRIEYADAVKQGLIPAGASRAYMEAYKATELDTKTQRFGLELHQAYDESGLKNLDDPGKMDEFIRDFTKKYRGGALMREGADMYTPREIADSKFDEKLNGYTQSLLAQHIQYRADERTKIGKEAAQTNAGLKIDSMFDPHDDTTHATTANAIMETFFDPKTGIASNGITNTEANKLMVDVIASKMVQYGDANFSKVADHITTFQNNKLGSTQYARNKFKEAEDSIIAHKIRDSNWNWQERERRTLEDGGLGPEAQAQLKIDEKKRQQELWAHQDKMNSHAERMANRSEVNADIDIKANSRVTAILTGLQAHDMTNPRVKEAFDWLRYNAPDKWMTMNNYVSSHKKEQSAFHDTPASDLVSARFRYEMSRNPLGFDPSQIMAAANNGTINPKSVGPLMDDWDKARTHMDNPLLQNPGFTKLIEDLRKVAVKDANDQYGPGAINAMRVEQQMRQNAYDWIEKNPKGSYLDFIKEMRAQAEPLAMDFSPEFAKDEANKLAKKQNPKPVPQKDTRSAYEKLAPNALGGKDKPEPVTPEAQGPPPMKPSEAFNVMKPEAQAQLRKLMQDPNADEMDIEATIYNSGLYAYMKSNGRSAAEFKALKDQLLGARKNFSK